MAEGSHTKWACRILGSLSTPSLESGSYLGVLILSPSCPCVLQAEYLLLEHPSGSRLPQISGPWLPHFSFVVLQVLLWARLCKEWWLQALSTAYSCGRALWSRWTNLVDTAKADLKCLGLVRTQNVKGLGDCVPWRRVSQESAYWLVTYVVLNSYTWNVKLFIYLLCERIRGTEYLAYLTRNYYYYFLCPYLGPTFINVETSTSV